MRKWLQRARPEGLVLQRLSASLANEFAPDPSMTFIACPRLIDEKCTDRFEVGIR
jgi:hypothetical protein